MEQVEINDFAEFKANITRLRPQATGEEFSIGPVAARDFARRSPGIPEENSLAIERTEVEYQTALPSSTSEEFVSEQPAEEAAFGEGSVQTASSVDVLEISTSEGEQADAMDREESPNRSCSDNKENYLHLDEIEVGASSFNVPMSISPAHKLSRRFGGTGDFRLRGYDQKLYPSARTATLPHVELPHGSRGSASPLVGLLDISSESRSETFAADSYSDVDHDVDCSDDTDSYDDTAGSSGEAVRRNAGVMCMLRFKTAGSSSAQARPGGAAMPRRRQQEQRRLQQQEKQKLKLNKKRQTEDVKRKRRPQVRSKPRGPQDVRPPAAYKTSRDIRRARVGGDGTDGALVAQSPAEVVAASPTEEVWKSLSEPDQRLVDTWPCREPSGDELQPSCARGVEEGNAPSREGRRLIEEWLRCSDGSPGVCAAGLRRLADGRASWGWLEARLLARDVVDALLTGAIKLLPGPIRGTESPPSPHVLVIHTDLVDHERCPLGQYTKGLSYLLQTLGARKSSWRRPSRLLGSVSATYPLAGKVEACAEAIVVIDARGDTVGVKTKKLLNILVSGGGETRLCDPALSVWPVTIRKILVVNTSTVLRAMLMPQRVALNSVNSVMSSPGGDVDGEGGARKSERESDEFEVEPRIVCGVESASSPCRGGSASPRRSFLALSGWSSREWLRYEVGEDIARCLPLELGGGLDLRSWSWEGWVGRRMQREDMMTESKLGPLDDSLAPAAWRFLDACHALAESQCIQGYARVLSDALAGGLSIPVTWVKRTLCDVVQARQAHEPPWRDTFGGSGSGRSGGSGSGAIFARRKSLNREWTQLWKDMGRDVVEIHGVRIDPLADGQGVAEGGVGGEAAGGARDPDGVLTPLAKEIARIGAEGGLTKMPEVECFLAARDILLSTKRTSSGGDVWVCVDRMCGRRDMVVVCPASHEADPLHVEVEFEPEPESEPEPEPEPPLPGPDQSVVLDRRSSTTDPPSPPVSPFRVDEDNSDSSNSDSFPDHQHHQRKQKQQQQEVSTLGQSRRAVSRPSALVTSPHSLPGCNCGRWPVCPVLDAASVAGAGAGVGGERGAISGLARGIVSNPRQKSNPAPSVDACASGMGSDPCHGGRGGMSAPRCRFAMEETNGSCFWPEEPDRDGERDDSSDEQIGKDGGCLDPPQTLPERALSGGLDACPRAQTQLLTPSTAPKHQGEVEADVFKPAFESARRPPTPASLRRRRASSKALLGGGRSPYGGHARDDSFGFLPSPKAELCGRRSPCGALSRDDSFGPRGPFFPSPKAELGSRVSSRAALRPDGLFRSRSPARPSPNAKVGRRDSSRVALVRDNRFSLRSPSRPSPTARLGDRDSTRAALLNGDLFRSRRSFRPSPKAELGRDGSVCSRGGRSGTTDRVRGGESSSMQVADDVRLTPKMIEKQREPPASAAAGVGSYFWGLEDCGSPEGLRHASFPAEFIDVMDCDEAEGVRGCVKVTVTTTMSYRICDTNLMNEDDGVIRIVKGVFERVFRVRADGALEGLQPTDGNPVVRMELAN